MSRARNRSCPWFFNRLTAVEYSGYRRGRHSVFGPCGEQMERSGFQESPGRLLDNFHPVHDFGQLKCPNGPLPVGTRISELQAASRSSTGAGCLTSPTCQSRMKKMKEVRGCGGRGAE